MTAGAIIGVLGAIQNVAKQDYELNPLLLIGGALLLVGIIVNDPRGGLMFAGFIVVPIAGLWVMGSLFEKIRGIQIKKGSLTGSPRLPPHRASSRPEQESVPTSVHLPTQRLTAGSTNIGDWLENERGSGSPLPFEIKSGIRLSPAGAERVSRFLDDPPSSAPRSTMDEFFSRCESPPEKALLAALIKLASLSPTEDRLTGILDVKPQQIIGRYRVDFLVNDELVIEVDGRQYHSTDDAFYRDRERDQYLHLKGYRVVRFAARQILDSPTAVANSVLTIAQKPVRGH